MPPCDPVHRTSSADVIAMNERDALPTAVAPAAVTPLAADSRQSRDRRFAGIAAALALLGLAAWMLSAFIPALAWAVILAIATWPIYLRARLHMGRTLGAAAVTALIAIAVLAPLVFAAVEAVRDLRGVVAWVIETRKEGFVAPEWIAQLPMVGGAVANWLETHLQPDTNPLSGTELGSFTEVGRTIGRQAVRRVTTLLFALLIVFFIFRDSETLLHQFHAVGDRLLGAPAHRLGKVAAAAVRGTVDGLVLVGLAEGILIGIAYAVAGVPHAGFFGALTGIMSAIPFAAPLVFIGAGLWLVTQAQVAAAIGVIAFGSVVVFIADHFVRPVLIGGSTRLPFVWVLLGILGGVESFGLLGLFLGPVLLAVLMSLWRELAGEPARA
jgi:predicted PurR-regulated permease PerM